MSNPIRKSIEKMAREIVSEQSHPVWGIVKKINDDSELGIKTADVAVKDRRTGDTIVIMEAPILLGGLGIQDAQVKVNDGVKVVFEEGRGDSPVIIQVIPKRKLNKNIYSGAWGNA